MNATPSLTPVQMRTFVSAAAVIAPETGALPAAGELDLAAEVDKVLRARADLLAPLLSVLGELSAPVDAAQLHRLHDDDPARLRLLVTAVCAAYFLHADVRAALDYPGQQALTLPRGGFGAEELVLRQMQRPKRYRQP